MFTQSPRFNVADGRPYKVSSRGTHFHPDTSDTVARHLDDLIASGKRVRLFTGEPDTGVAWASEYDVYGTIGRSTGPCKVPLLIEPGEDGGSQLLDHCIVGILTRAQNWVYKHPKLNFGEWIQTEKVEKLQGATYKAALYHNGQIFSRHRTVKQAQALMDFMTGKRLSLPA